MSTIEVEKEKLQKLALAIQSHTKAAAEVVDKLAGEQVKKEALSTLEDLESKGMLEQMEPHQKQAHADNLRYDRSAALDLLRKFAEHKQQRDRQALSSVGEPVSKSASADEMTESDKIWQRMQNL